MRRSSGPELDTFFPVRPECLADVPKTRFKPRVCKDSLPSDFYDVAIYSVVQCTRNWLVIASASIVKSWTGRSGILCYTLLWLQDYSSN